MRNYSYDEKWIKLLTPDIVSLLTRIHEFKGEQNLFIEAKKDLNLRFRGSSNQRLIDVPKSLAAGETVLWEDWQGDRKGMI